MTILPSGLDVQQLFIQQAMSDLHTCMPAEIVAVRDGSADARQFVDVQPMLQRVIIDENGDQQNESLPVVQMVPVAYMQGGGFFISMPLAVGDTVLLVFAERSLDTWIQNAERASKQPVMPGDLSMHSLEGAIAMPCGPAPRSGLLTGVDASDLVVATSSGTVLQRYKADGQVSIAEGTQFVALANLVATELDRVKSDINTLKSSTSTALGSINVAAGGAFVGTTVKGPFDISTAAIASAPASVAATKTKAT
jgi:hypothetical protein